MLTTSQIIFTWILIVFLLAKTKGIPNISDIPNKNWTSCEQFINNTIFDRLSVIDVDWKIFYFWNYEMENTYHIKFSLPTPVLVDRFRVELHDDLDPPINWSDAELFMETSIDFCALFIKTETPGMYKIIPSTAFLVKSIPNMIFALKVKDGNLGIMNCKLRLCYALAPVDKMPNNETVHTVAEKLGFRGDFNRSYLVKYDPPSPPLTFSRDDGDDGDDDVQLEMSDNGYQ